MLDLRQFYVQRCRCCRPVVNLCALLVIDLMRNRLDVIVGGILWLTVREDCNASGKAPNK